VRALVERKLVQERTSIPPSRIVIADDHPLFRSALRLLVEESPETEVVAEATDGQQALDLCRRFKPDLVLMDVIMPRMGGIAATRTIKAELHHIIVLVMTASEILEDLAEALRAGAGGYILKSASSQQIIDAVRKALEGEFPLDQEVATRLLLHLTKEKRAAQEAVRPVPQALFKKRRRPPALERELSPREVEVLRLVAHGYTNPQIAQELLLSTSTVKNHVQQLLGKLGVSDRTQAAVVAIEMGLLSN
jgi:two-component system, NarL family, response regulator LiaR